MDREDGELVGEMFRDAGGVQGAVVGAEDAVFGQGGVDIGGLGRVRWEERGEAALVDVCLLSSREGGRVEHRKGRRDGDWKGEQGGKYRLYRRLQKPCCLISSGLLRRAGI